MHKWELFQVGMKRAEWIGLPEGMIAEWQDACGLILFVFYDKPRENEIKEMSAGGRLEVRFKDVDGVGFFAIKFGEQPWADCAFSPNLYPDEPKFEKPPVGKTYALHVMLVDTSVGELKVLRTVALGRDFSEKFRQWGLVSLDKNIGRLFYNRVIEETFKKYPEPETLARDASFGWIAAHGEDAPRRDVREREAE